MSNILYIHGYGSNKNSTTGKYLQQILAPQHTIYTDTYPLEDYNKTITKIFNNIHRWNISCVIGSSLGGFYALALGSTVRKIVINPCMFPSIEIPKIGILTDKQISVFEQEEDELYQYLDNEDRISTVGIFGRNDELINYSSYFKKKYFNGDNILFCNGKHRLTFRELSDYVPIALTLLPNKPFWEEDYLVPLTEHFVNAPPQDIETKYKYMYDVYKILVDSYAYIGGLATVRKPEDLLEFDFWKMVRKGGKIVCCTLYKTKYGGRKVCYSGTDGTKLGKDEFTKMLQDDIRLADRCVWREVSDKMEYKLIKEGAVPIPVETLIKLLGPRKSADIYRIHKDGYHYDRVFRTTDRNGTEIVEYHTKICFGNIEGIPITNEPKKNIIKN